MTAWMESSFCHGLPRPYSWWSRADPSPSTYLVSTEAVRDSTVLAWDGPTTRDREVSPTHDECLLTTMNISLGILAHAALTSQTRERLAHVLLGYAQCRSKVSGGNLDVTNQSWRKRRISPSQRVVNWANGTNRCDSQHRGKVLYQETTIPSRRQPARVIIGAVSGADDHRRSKPKIGCNQWHEKVDPCPGWR
jgi:hypothetical protein